MRIVNVNVDISNVMNDDDSFCDMLLTFPTNEIDFDFLCVHVFDMPVVFAVILVVHSNA